MTISAAQLLAMSESDFPANLIDKPVPIPQDSILLIAGNRETMKSMLALQLSIAIAEGKSFLGSTPNQKGRVLYVEEEVGPKGLMLRLKAMANGAKPTNLGIRSKKGCSLESVSTELYDVIDAIQPVLVVFDPIGPMMGSLNENDTKDAETIRKSVLNIQKISQCTVCLLHHWNKRGRIRGNLTFENMADVILETQRKKDTIVVTCTKHRHEMAPPPFGFKLTSSGLQLVSTSPLWLDDALASFCEWLLEREFEEDQLWTVKQLLGDAQGSYSDKEIRESLRKLHELKVVRRIKKSAHNQYIWGYYKKLPKWWVDFSPSTSDED